MVTIVVAATPGLCIDESKIDLSFAADLLAGSSDHSDSKDLGFGFLAVTIAGLGGVSEGRCLERIGTFWRFS